MQDKSTPVPRGYAETRETAELADALDDMLARLDASRARTAQALETARDYAAAAAHELRTPLTMMRTDLDVLRAHPDLDAVERTDVLAELTNSLTRMERTLTALGQLARGDLAEPRPAVPVDLADIVADAVADVRRISPEADIGAALPAEPVVVTGWPDGLRITVDNLLANAVRHGISERRRSVQVSVRHDDTVAQVVVDDAGPGIPLEEREAVFARFRRGRNAPRTGSGLGLALVSQQAALHGGRAWVEASPLGGTRAVLQIASEPVEHSSGSRKSVTADSAS